jgi:hypothetical protein
MINIYPTQIEAVDRNGSLLFKLSTFDEYTAELEMKTAISQDGLHELFDAIQRAVDMLELKT